MAVDGRFILTGSRRAQSLTNVSFDNNDLVSHRRYLEEETNTAPLWTRKVNSQIVPIGHSTHSGRKEWTLNANSNRTPRSRTNHHDGPVRLMQNSLENRAFLRPTGKVKIECSNCFEKKEMAQFQQQYNSKCQHRKRTICDDCLNQYIMTCFQTIVSVRIECSEANCKTKFNSAQIRQILIKNSDKSQVKNYDRFLQNHKLRGNPDFVRCAYGCGWGQLHQDLSHPQVTCLNCQRVTCAIHNVQWHEKITCEDYDRLHGMTDPQTTEWIKRNTKACPRCNSRIERNGGCSHMRCKCRTSFCWDCFGRLDLTTGLYRHTSNCPSAANDVFPLGAIPWFEEHRPVRPPIEVNYGRLDNIPEADASNAHRNRCTIS